MSEYNNLTHDTLLTRAYESFLMSFSRKDIGVSLEVGPIQILGEFIGLVHCSWDPFDHQHPGFLQLV
jgi:hypothetical protein